MNPITTPSQISFQRIGGKQTPVFRDKDTPRWTPTNVGVHALELTPGMGHWQQLVKLGYEVVRIDSDNAPPPID